MRSPWRTIETPSASVIHTSGEYAACRKSDAYSSSCLTRSVSSIDCFGVASSTSAIRFIGATQAALLMFVMMRAARSSTAGASHGGRSSFSPCQSGACWRRISSRRTGSPKLTCTLPKRWRSVGNVRSSVNTDSFSFAAPDSSPMYVLPSTNRS